MEEALDNLRNFVHNLGWLSEGSQEQAKAILDDMQALADNLITESALRHPHLKKVSEET